MRAMPLVMAIVLGAAAVVLPSCSSKGSSVAKTEKTCTGALALRAKVYRGAGMRPKTLALTFDDGPGARTLELSEYLRDKGIGAAFFVNGARMADYPHVIEHLVEDGHVLGNHTQTHPDLTTLPAPAIVAEVEATDALIAPFVPSGRFMFRAPFGAFDDAVLAALQASPMKKYIGPIDWDIGAKMGDGQAADWDCWAERGDSVPPVLTVDACGQLYLQEIRRNKSGIVLLHDPYFIDDDPLKGGTVDMVKTIVPILVAEGYSFVRVDEVPEIAADLPPLSAADAGPPAADSGPPADAPTGDAAPPDPCAPGGAR